MSQIFSMYVQCVNMYIYECLSILLCVIRSWTALSRALCQADWPAWRNSLKAMSSVPPRHPKALLYNTTTSRDRYSRWTHNSLKSTKTHKVYRLKQDLIKSTVCNATKSPIWQLTVVHAVNTWFRQIPQCLILISQGIEQCYTVDYVKLTAVSCILCTFV